LYGLLGSNCGACCWLSTGCAGWGRLGEGEGEEDDGAAAGVVGGGDDAAVSFDDAVADCQAQAGAGVGGVGVGAVEAFEDGGVLAVGDADAAVGDLDRGEAVTVGLGGDGDPDGLSGRGVFQCVAEQVVES
jgi:hypothetical protein